MSINCESICLQKGCINLRIGSNDYEFFQGQHFHHRIYPVIIFQQWMKDQLTQCSLEVKTQEEIDLLELLKRLEQKEKKKALQFCIKMFQYYADQLQTFVEFLDTLAKGRLDETFFKNPTSSRNFELVVDMFHQKEPVGFLKDHIRTKRQPIQDFYNLGCNLLEDAQGTNAPKSNSTSEQELKAKYKTQKGDLRKIELEYKEQTKQIIQLQDKLLTQVEIRSNSMEHHPSLRQTSQSDSPIQLNRINNISQQFSNRQFYDTPTSQSQTDVNQNVLLTNLKQQIREKDQQINEQKEEIRNLNRKLIDQKRGYDQCLRHNHMQPITDEQLHNFSQITENHYGQQSDIQFQQ